MSVFCSHHDSLHDPVGTSRRQVFLASCQIQAGRLRTLTRRTIDALKVIHQAIVDAKIRRLERELTFHEIPRCPIVLGDKWDF